MSFILAIAALARYPRLASRLVRVLTRPFGAVTCALFVVLFALSPALLAGLSGWSAPTWLPAVVWSGVGAILLSGVRSIRFFLKNSAPLLQSSEVLVLFCLVLVQGLFGGVFMFLILNEAREPVLNEPIIGLIVGVAAAALLRMVGEMTEVAARPLPRVEPE